MNLINIDFWLVFYIGFAAFVKLITSPIVTDRIPMEYRQWLLEPACLKVSSSFYSACGLLLMKMIIIFAFIPSGSAIPNLLIGDRVLVNGMRYGVSIPVINKVVIPFSAPKRGDMVVLKLPAMKIPYVKRIIGLPNDRIRLYVNNDVSINGKLLTHTVHGAKQEDGHKIILMEEDNFGRKYTIRCHESRQSRSSYEDYIVPEGHYFVMGDNRNESSDSRVFGSVKRDLIYAKPLLVVWSVDDITHKIRWNRIFKTIS